MEKEKEPEYISVIAVIADFIGKHFYSVPMAIADADDLRTTEELTTMIGAHMGGDIEKQDVMTALQSIDAYSKLIGDKIYWILRKKHQSFGD